MSRYFANGTEYEAWAHNWCYRCARDAFNSCPILTKAFCYPDEVIAEWLEQDTSNGYRLGDNVHCIEFKPKGYRGGKEPTPEPPPPGQDHLFDPPAGPKMYKQPRPEQVTA